MLKATQHPHRSGDEMDMHKDMKGQALDYQQGKDPLFRARDKTPPPPPPSDEPPRIVQSRSAKRARTDLGLFNKRRRLDNGFVRTNGVEDSDVELDEIGLIQKIIDKLIELIQINPVDYVFKLRSEFLALQVAVMLKKRFNPLISLQEKIGTLNYLLERQEGVLPSEFLCEGLTLQALQLEYDESSAPIFTEITAHLESLVNKLTGSPHFSDDSETAFKF